MDTVGVRVEAQGEQAFKQSLANINAGLKVNASEMAMVTAEYGKNEKSIEALNAKSNALKNQIASQTEKVSLLEGALRKSAATTGESSARTMKLQADYNNARASLAGMNKELVANDQALEASQKKSRSLADAINGIAQMAGVRIPPAMQGMISKLDNVSATGAALVGVLVGVTVALGKMTIETAKTADKILTLSSTTGISTTALQEFAYASELIDVSSETMQSSLTKMIRSMNSARDGTKATSEAYQSLGINVTNADGSLRDANTVFYEVIDALGKMKNETDRDALSMEVFGKSARELNPLIEAGSGRLRELAQEAHNVGYVMSEETLGKFGQMDDAMQKMNLQGDALKRQFAEYMLPVFIHFFDMLEENKDTVKGIIEVFALLLNIIFAIIGAILKLAEAIAKLFEAGFEKLGIPMNTSVKTADSINENALTAQGRTNMRGYARGTINALPGWALVGEVGPEYVKLRGGERIHNAQETRQMLLQAPAGSTTNQYNYYVTIDAKNVREFNDVVRMAERARQDQRAR